MNYLSLDTNTWIYLCNGTEPVKYLHFINNEVEKGNITILLPETVKKEWEKHKDVTVTKGSKKYLDDILDSLKRVGKILGDKGEPNMLDFLLDNQDDKEYFSEVIERFKNKKDEIIAAISENIKLVDELFLKSSTITIQSNRDVYVKAGQFALEKLAPFGMKNSFADALIIFSLFDYIKSNQIENTMFISYNTEDFCKKENKKKFLHPDLKEEFENANNCQYFKYVGEALNTIEKNIASKQDLELIEYFQNYEDTDDKLVYCHICYGENDEINEVIFESPQYIIDESGEDKIDPNQLELNFSNFSNEVKLRNNESLIEVGHCDRCNSLHFKCVSCGHVNAMYDAEFNEIKQCEHCDFNYLISREFDKDGIEIVEFTIPKSTITCQSCGLEFDESDMVEDICTKCENRFSYE